MPDSGFLFLSGVCLFVGASLFLYPNAVLKLSKALNRTLKEMDDQLIRYRYMVGLLTFVATYAFFKIALYLPSFR